MLKEDCTHYMLLFCKILVLCMSVLMCVLKYDYRHQVELSDVHR